MDFGDRYVIAVIRKGQSNWFNSPGENGSPWSRRAGLSHINTSSDEQVLRLCCEHAKPKLNFNVGCIPR